MIADAARSPVRSLVLGTALLPTLGWIGPRAPRLVEVEGTRVVELAGGRIRYQSQGTGDEALVFLHGFNSQLATWNAVWPRLDRGTRRVRLDIAGFGGSVWTAASYSLPSQADRVIAFLDALGLSRITLVGVSMGGSLAAWIAAHHPARIKGLVLLAPSGFPGALRYRGRFEALLAPGLPNRWATRLARTALYRRLHPASSALHALTVTASYGAAWADALGSIRTHAWLVWSRGDATVPFTYAEAVARSLPASTLLPLSPLVGHDIPGCRAELIGTLANLVHRGTPPVRIRHELANLLHQQGDA